MFGQIYVYSNSKTIEDVLSLLWAVSPIIPTFCITFNPLKICKTGVASNIQSINIKLFNNIIISVILLYTFISLLFYLRIITGGNMTSNCF